MRREQLQKKGLIIEKPIDYLFFARNFQILGRHEEALELYEQMDKTQRILFYMAQVYFKEGSNDKFNSLSFVLNKNIYYRYMYWQLNGEFLRKEDDDAFGNFSYRSYLDVTH